MKTAILEKRHAIGGIPSLLSENLLTAQEYLAIERNAETKSEFHRGEMIPMPGASLKHIKINANLLHELILQVEARNFDVLGSDMRVRVPDTGLYTYPDLTVCIDEPIVEEKELDVLTNPSLIVEILSKSTEKYDRGAKFEHYKTLDSLREYLLLTQDRISAELFERQPDGSWTKTLFEGAEGVLRLPALGVEIPLEKLYARVKLDA